MLREKVLIYQSILFLKSGAVGAEIKPAINRLMSAITRLMYAILAINPGKTAINPGKTLQNSTFIYFNICSVTVTHGNVTGNVTVTQSNAADKVKE